MDLMDALIVDNKATRRKLAPTINRNLHYLKEDQREVRVPQFLFRAVRRNQCNLIPCLRHSLPLLISSLMVLNTSISIGHKVQVTTKAILRISRFHKDLETKEGVDMPVLV
ncbi:hypothetical protein PanWU01x14_132500 [Parasponia andersonii]|uniref:Uncharacterized protein n=1 Tax=Parasponia andersonii TaxID=3476 RepID=A0A2P5CQM0_PARAD|nr:hypothetical protein PanWU01x14_132500 [Parasponia andersonii]